MKRTRIQVVLKCLPKNSVGAEVGVREAGFSLKMLRIVRPAHLHLIDPWRREFDGVPHPAPFGQWLSQRQLDAMADRVRRRFAFPMRKGVVSIHRGLSEDVLDSFPDNSLDWVYIDGDHRYEYVKTDLELSRAKVRDGGIIAGDDYNHPACRDKSWGGGVKPAVDEYLASGRGDLMALEAFQFVIRNTS
jgi:hypothetical protein